jgi:beta-lactam-binding protein with PASTA domain
MNRVFAITAVAKEATLMLADNRQGKVAFTVTNTTERAIRGQLNVKPLDSMKSEWLSIVGEKERDFPAHATQQVEVGIAIPPEVAAGKYAFRLDAVSVVNPDEDYTEGPNFALEVKAKTEDKKPFPWWIIVVAVLVLALGGLAAWYFLKPKMVNVPNAFTAKSIADAEKMITDRGLKFTRENKEDRTVTEEKLISQEPGEGQVKAGSEIKLIVSVPVPPLKLDNFVGKNVKEVREFLEGKSRTVSIQNQEIDTEPQGKILKQNPGEGTTIKVSDPVTLTIAVLVNPRPLPAVIGKPVSTAKYELEALGLKVSTKEEVNPSVAHEQVVSQDPASGTPVKAGERIELKYAITLVSVPGFPQPQFVQFPFGSQWIGGLPWSIAQQILTNAGFTLKEVRGDCGMATVTSPGAGTLAPKGMPVVLYTTGNKDKVCYTPPIKFNRAILSAATQLKYELQKQ